jgi:hypothetical protein
MNNDGSFVTHQVGTISSTFTSDWYLRKGESRDKMGEWLKKATVRSGPAEDAPNQYTQFPIELLAKQNHQVQGVQQVRPLQSSMDTRRERTAEGRVNTEDELPIQTLGHIQHQCEALSEVHTLAHHRC